MGIDAHTRTKLSMRRVALLGAATLLVAACSGGGSSTATDPTPTVAVDTTTLDTTTLDTTTLDTTPDTAGDTVPESTVPFVPSGPMCPPTPQGRIAYELGFEGAGVDGADVWTVQVVHPDGSNDSQLIGGEQYLGLGQPSWSPDGTRAVVSAMVPNDQFLIVRCDGTIETVLEGLEMETLSYPLSIDTPNHPSWSPDGKTLSFTSADGLFLIDPADPYPTRQVDIGIDLTVVRGRASWSPDGDRLVFGATAADGNTDLYVVGIDGSGITRLTTDPGDDYQPAWSPDGSTIAFRSMRDGKLWLMAADGSGQEPMFSGEGAAAAYQPSWSPDGTQLVYVSGEVGDTRVHIIDADGSGDRQVTATEPSPRFEGWPTWVGT